jgi:hypothetical protein
MRNRLIYWIVSISVAFFPAAALSQGAVSSELEDSTESIEMKAQFALKQCEQIKSLTSALLCRGAVQARLATYTQIDQRFLIDVQLISRANAAVLRSHPIKARTAGESARSIAVGINARSNLLTAIETGAQATLEAQNRIKHSLGGLAELLAGQESSVLVICELHDTASITCAELSVIVANRQNDDAELVLSDIERLQEIFDLPIGDEILFGCGPGMWSSMGLPDFVIEADNAGLSGFMAESGYGQILSKCSQLADSMTSSRAEDLLNAGGSSGITGLDTLGIRGLCGLDFNGSDADEFTQNALALSQAMRESCEATLQATMGSDGASLPNGRKRNGETKEVESVEEVKDNGDGTETVSGKNSDGTSYEYVRYKDSGSQDYSIDVKYKDGSKGHFDTNDRSNFRAENPDGSAVNISSEGNDVSVIVTDSDGNIIDTARGSFYEDRFGQVNLSNRDLSRQLNKLNRRHRMPIKQWTQNLLDRIYSSRHAPPDLVPIPDSSACAGEPCDSCFDFEKLNPKVQEAAESLEEGDLWMLRSFERVSQCCGNRSVFRGDPTVAIVNAEADFMCSGSGDPASDAMNEACQARCSVASSENCMADCRSAFNLSRGLNVSILERMCLYAISDACFGYDGGIPVPPPPSPPLPVEVGASGLLVEPFLSWEATEVPMIGIDPHDRVPIIVRPR